MEGYRPVDSFDESNAAHYDDLAVRGDEAAAVSFLHQLAGGGPALELGIGPGQIALPLAARGADVDGIDLSEPMVARLRAKPDGNQLDVTIGNFADVGVPGGTGSSMSYSTRSSTSSPRKNRCGASKTSPPT